MIVWFILRMLIVLKLNCFYTRTIFLQVLTNYFSKKILVAPARLGPGPYNPLYSGHHHLKKIGCEIIFAGSAIQLALIKESSRV